MAIVSLAAALVCTALAFAPEPVLELLEFAPGALGNGQFWRLWTGHLVHFSMQHALADALVLLAAGAIVERENGRRRWLLALALCTPLISAALLFATPALTYYRGASAIAVLAIVLACQAYWRSNPRSRPLVALIGLALAAKTMGEALGYSLGAAGLPDDVAVAWQAHAFGAMAALATAAMWSGRKAHSYPLQRHSQAVRQVADCAIKPGQHQ